jgi:hypothetical protein
MGAEASDGTTLTLAYFPFGVCAGPALVHFSPTPTLSTPAFGTDRLAALFCTAAFTGAPAFGGALAFGAASAFAGLALDEATFDETAFDGAAFDEAAPMLFAITEAFRAAACQ